MSPSRSKKTPARAPRKTQVREKRILKRAVSADVDLETAPEPMHDHEPIVSPDEKRELILAHAAMRRPHDPVQLLSLWAGVAATFIVIVGAWWWSSKPEYLRVFSTPFLSGFEPAVQDAKTFGKTVTNITADRTESLRSQLEKTAARLDELDRQSRRDQGAVTRMTSLIESASAATTGTAVTATTTKEIFQKF